MIYFLEAEIVGRIKIGYTSRKDLSERIAEIQSASPVPLRLVARAKGSVRRERLLHERFQECRLHGEWFQPNRKMMRLIARLQGRWPLETTLRKSRKKRSALAAQWLAARFAEKELWWSSELFERARTDRISKGAIFEAKIEANIEASKGWLGDSVAWFWRRTRPAEVSIGGPIGRVGLSSEIERV